MDILHIALTTAEFARLRLARDPRTGHMTYSRDAVAEVLRDHDITAAVLGDEDAVCDLILGWYVAHRSAGGAPDPAIEQVVAEVMAEDEFGADRIQRAPERPQ